MSHWTRNADSGSWNLDLPAVGIYGLVQHERAIWRAAIFSLGDLGNLGVSLCFPRLVDAKVSVEERIELVLRIVIMDLPQTPRINSG